VTPELRELLISFGILFGSYLSARLLSFLFGEVLSRAALRTATGLDDRLVLALKRPVTYGLFLFGAWGAVHRAPLPERFAARLDSALFVVAVLVTTLGLLRAYGILVEWYATESKAAGQDGSLMAEIGPLASKLGKTFIVLIATITTLQQLGVNVASLVVSLGVGSLAIGLAAQDTLSNMFAGFTLMVDRPFRIGDRVQLSTGEVGDVEAVGMRATRIRTPDDTILIVPNSLLIKDRLVNQSRPTHSVTTRVEVRVAYGSDLAEALRILRESALASPHVDAERAPVALVTKFGEFAVSLLVVFWVRDYNEQGLASSEVHEQIYRRLAEARIEIPYPTRRILAPSGRAANPSAEV
jgi:small-conductance mechanosensitive channel